MTDFRRQRASPVDVASYIDQQPVGGFQIKLLLTCAAVLFLDGFDTRRSAMWPPRSPRNGG